jgi:uncharacterized protein YbaR (Trm112 family)
MRDAGRRRIDGRSANLSRRDRVYPDGSRMHQSKLLSFLCCPDDRSELTPASETVVGQINAAIRTGRLRNEAGRLLDETIDGGLVRKHRDLLYPIVDGIPILLRDEAIPIDQFEPADNDKAK